MTQWTATDRPAAWADETSAVRSSSGGRSASSSRTLTGPRATPPTRLDVDRRGHRRHPQRAAGPRPGRRGRRGSLPAPASVTATTPRAARPAPTRGEVGALATGPGGRASGRGDRSTPVGRPPRHLDAAGPVGRVGGEHGGRGPALSSIHRMPGAVLDPDRPHAGGVERVAGRAARTRRRRSRRRGASPRAGGPGPDAARRRGRRPRRAPPGEQSTEVRGPRPVANRWMWWSARPGSSGAAREVDDVASRRPAGSAADDHTVARWPGRRTTPGRTDARRSTRPRSRRRARPAPPRCRRPSGPRAAARGPSAGDRRADRDRRRASSSGRPRRAALGGGRTRRPTPGGTGERTRRRTTVRRATRRPGAARAASAPQSGSATASAAKRGAPSSGCHATSPAGRGRVVAEADPVRRPAVGGDRHPHPVAGPGEEGVGVEAEGRRRPGPGRRSRRRRPERPGREAAAARGGRRGRAPRCVCPR